MESIGFLWQSGASVWIGREVKDSAYALMREASPLLADAVLRPPSIDKSVDSTRESQVRHGRQFGATFQNRSFRPSCKTRGFEAEVICPKFGLVRVSLFV
jgi:hypothetical protein